MNSSHRTLRANQALASCQPSPGSPPAPGSPSPAVGRAVLVRWANVGIALACFWSLLDGQRQVLGSLALQGRGEADSVSLRRRGVAGGTGSHGSVGPGAPARCIGQSILGLSSNMPRELRTKAQGFLRARLEAVHVQGRTRLAKWKSPLVFIAHINLKQKYPQDLKIG
jgi:hypothetical protein